MEGIDKRLKWIRQQLKMTLSHVSEISGIHRSTIYYLENVDKYRTSSLFVKLIEVYNKEWTKTFPDITPRYKGQEVPYISTQFLITGKDENLERLEEFNNEIISGLRKELVNMASENEMLKQQIEFLKAETVGGIQ